MMSTNDRLAGYRKAVTEANLNAYAVLVIAGESDADVAEHATFERFTTAETPATALVVSNNQMTLASCVHRVDAGLKCHAMWQSSATATSTGLMLLIRSCQPWPKTIAHWRTMSVTCWSSASNIRTDRRRPSSYQQRSTIASPAAAAARSTAEITGTTLPSAAVERLSISDLILRARVVAQRPTRTILGIVGAPGAGRSTVAEQIEQALGDAAVLVRR